MILHIRGALGTQLFEYLIGAAKAKVGNTAIEEVHISTAGNIVEPCKTDWLSQIIEVPCPVKLVEQVNKQRVWTNVDNFKLINETKVIDNIISKVPLVINDYSILHVRGKDRCIASEQDYCKIMHSIGPTVKLLGDDQLMINNLIAICGFGENISQDELTDWQTIKGAKQVCCAFTNFTISSLLFRPSVDIKMLSRENSNGPVKIHPISYECIDQLFNHIFTNATWL